MNETKNTALLQEAASMWHAMSAFRRDRERCKRYTYGDQWGDTVNVEGRTMREDEYIRSQGNIPLKNNLIRRLVRNVVGVYRSQGAAPCCTARDPAEQQAAATLQTALDHVFQTNGMKEMLARGLEEYLISGLVVHKKWWGYSHGRLDCWTSVVSPAQFFCDTAMCDARGWDAGIVGEIHDLDPRELLVRFGRGEKQRLSALRRIYGIPAGGFIPESATQFGEAPHMRSFLQAPTGRCRVIEVWQRQLTGRYRCFDTDNGEMFLIEEAEKHLADAAGHTTAWFADEVWHYSFLAPDGTVLETGVSPYAHGSHPYVFRAYPFIDGEIHSFVADVVDQQRYTNRLITLHDWVIRAAGKGALMVPTQLLGPLSLDEFARRWSAPNSVIPYNHRPGVPEPHQVSTNMSNLGTAELLAHQLRFFEDISGVNDALQGRVTYAGTSGSLYSQQTYNATVALLDLLQSYSQFVVDSATKDLRNIQQFYPPSRFHAIAGDAENIDDLSDLEFDLNLSDTEN